MCGTPRTTTGAIVLANEVTLLGFNPFVFKERELYKKLLKDYEVPSQLASIQITQRYVLYVCYESVERGGIKALWFNGLTS